MRINSNISTLFAQRMRELALQAGTGTLGQTDCSFLDEEFQTLLNEYSRIVQTQNFNGRKLFNSSANAPTLNLGLSNQEHISLGTSSLEVEDIFTKQVTRDTGTFTSSTSVSLPHVVSGPVKADLDGDGHLDALV